MPLQLPPRQIRHWYQDPLDLIWLATAQRLGITVERSSQVYATSDGHGLLMLGAPDTLDPDDSLGQMIFHELCHWITNGLHTFHEPDWGFALDSDFDWREHACLRLQAALARQHGLGTLLAPTSDFRAYYDALPADPFQAMPGWPDENQVVALAVEALARSQHAPWHLPMGEALAATARLHMALQPLLPWLPGPDSEQSLDCLWGAGAAQAD